MNRWKIASHIVFIALVMASEVAILAWDPGPLRMGLALWVIFLAPGWAVLRLIEVPMSLTAALATAVGISVSINILLALALFYVGWWSVELATTILLAIVVVLVLAGLPIVRRVARQLWVATTDEGVHP